MSAAGFCECGHFALNVKTTGKWLKRFTYYGIWAGFGLGVYAVALIVALAS